MPAKDGRNNLSGKKIRMRMVAKKMLESGGTASVSAAMREAGYSPASARNPHKLTGSKTWAQLMDEFISDEQMAKLHGELAAAGSMQTFDFPDPPAPKRVKKLVNQPNGGAIFNDSDEDVTKPRLKPVTAEQIGEIISSVPGCRLIRVVRRGEVQTAYYVTPDNVSRRHALNIAYKLRGRYHRKEEPPPEDPFEKMSNAELAEYIAKTKAVLLKKKPPK